MKILVVDDDRFIHEMVKMALASLGDEIHHAFGTEEAMELFHQHDDIDLVITDIVMPGQDGTKLIQQIKQINELMPVLAMTGGIENAVDDYVCLANMYSDFTLAKPFTKTALLDGIASAITRADTNAHDETPDEALFDNLINILDKCGKPA